MTFMRPIKITRLTLKLQQILMVGHSSQPHQSEESYELSNNMCGRQVVENLAEIKIPIMLKPSFVGIPSDPHLLLGRAKAFRSHSRMMATMMMMTQVMMGPTMMMTKMMIAVAMLPGSWLERGRRLGGDDL